MPALGNPAGPPCCEFTCLSPWGEKKFPGPVFCHLQHELGPLLFSGQAASTLPFPHPLDTRAQRLVRGHSAHIEIRCTLIHRSAGVCLSISTAGGGGWGIRSHHGNPNSGRTILSLQKFLPGCTDRLCHHQEHSPSCPTLKL